MPEFTAWFPFALTGALMTLFGTAKLYGLCRGIVSGRDRPFVERLCGG
jgi:hypothetical protein